MAILLIKVLLGIFAALAALAVVLFYCSRESQQRRYRRRAGEAFVGRQQIRAAARHEGYRAIGGSPVSRRTKRNAARELARKVTS